MRPRELSGWPRVPYKGQEMSQRAADWCRLVSEGNHPVVAATKSGYENPETAAWRLGRDPRFQHIVRADYTARVLTLAGQALTTIDELRGEGYPAIVRLRASIWLAEAAGLGAVNLAMNPAEGRKHPTEMSEDELREFAARMREAADKALVTIDQVMAPQPGQLWAAPASAAEAPSADEEQE